MENVAYVRHAEVPGWGKAPPRPLFGRYGLEYWRNTSLQSCPPNMEGKNIIEYHPEII